MKRVLASWMDRLVAMAAPAPEPAHLALVRTLELDQPIAVLSEIHAQLVRAVREASRTAAHREETAEAIRRVQLAIVKRVERDGGLELRS